MSGGKCVFILGAGFSVPAGMPQATELLPLLVGHLPVHEEMRAWLQDLGDRLAWLSGAEGTGSPLALNIEQVFHYAHFDAETFRLRQQLSPVGRHDGPATYWADSERIESWLQHLEEALVEVIVEKQEKADLAPISRWAEIVDVDDTVVTFNYDTLAETALTSLGKPWNNATHRPGDAGIAVCKLHGSVDWIVAARAKGFQFLDLLFDKPNQNRGRHVSGNVEDDYCLWRFRTPEQMRHWVFNHYVQNCSADSFPETTGMAGLGVYKPLHRIPGLGAVWVNGMTALYGADKCIVVGFSMSDFDAMAQMQFAQIARQRSQEGRPLQVTVIDPKVCGSTEDRFRRVFRDVKFVKHPHEELDWVTVL